MAQQIIDNGTFLDDPTAEAVRDAFTKTNANFTELYNQILSGGYVKYYLNLEGININQSELQYIADAINRGQNYDVNGNNGTPFTKTSGTEFIFYTIVFVGGDQTNPRYLHRYYRVHSSTSQIGGNIPLQATSDDISPAGSLEINPETNQDLFIDLGEIASQNVWDVFNQGQSNGDAWGISGTTFVIATQNGTDKTWRFIGGDGLWGGDDFGTDPEIYQADANDFDLLSTEETVSFQETIPVNASFSAVNEIPLNNHESSIFNTVSNLTHFKAVNILLNGRAILRINSATQPTIETPNVIVSGSFVIGKEYTIKTIGTTDFTLIGASANTVGVVFVATGVGSGTGDAYENAEQYGGDVFMPNKEMLMEVWESGFGVKFRFIKQSVGDRHLDLGTISGATLNLDLTAGETFTATITENTTIAFVNPIVKVVTLDLTGDFSITFPAGTTIVGDSYDGTVWNKIAIEYKSATDIFVSITNR